MAVICVDRNTTAVNKLQVAINYIFDLAVRNVRGQIASNFFQGGAYVSATIFLELIEIANISYYDILIIESLIRFMVSNASQCLYFTSDLARNTLGAQCYRTAL